MSGIAGIIHFDGAPVEPGQVESMTAAMAHRGPDGIHHWVKGNVALGQCMLHTTPESLEETQPLANEDESLVLVMDGRVDNWEELRHELLGRGAVLRTRADAELVLRAYEVWGTACPDHIIGEYVFFIWDARQRRLFAARDAAGTRHFYYHAGRGWFAFASEIKGLLALDRIESKLNESRIFDYLVPEFDRDDVVGTIYQDILRLPAGHAMTVTERGVNTWRYWNPDELTENRFASLDECAEAFLEHMRIAVKCRLRSIGPVGGMLSGGLDSSSIVGLIRKEFQNELTQPLRTFSLIREDRENCKDWEHIQHMLKDGWIEPTIVPSSHTATIYRTFLDNNKAADEPFLLSHGLVNFAIYEAARENNCSVMLDGMAGDLLFYRPGRSLDRIIHNKMLSRIPALIGAYRAHGIENWFRVLARRSLAEMTPGFVKAGFRKYREKRAPLADDLKALHPDLTRQYLATKRAHRGKLEDLAKSGNDQNAHALRYTTGMLSFAHEISGQMAFSKGVEPRSPFSDRRLIEFGIQLPVSAKLSTPLYKSVLRNSMAGILPEAVRLRRDIGNHPGWKFHQQIIDALSHNAPDIWCISNVDKALKPWINTDTLRQLWHDHRRDPSYDSDLNLYALVLLSQWMINQKSKLFL